jgi:hypothetical protein
MTYESPLVTYCRERGLKLSRESYIAGCYPQGEPDPWTPEHEAELPEQFRWTIAGHDATFRPDSPKLADAEPTDRDHLLAWSKAVMVLDASEVLVRDLIERELVDIAGGSMSFAMLDAAARRLMQKIKPIREEAIKTAFRLVQSRVGDKPILDRSLAAWAQEFAREDARNIDTAIRVGLTEGHKSDEIARKVVGSMGMNGIDGVTEYTRHRMGHLGRAAILAIVRGKQG